VPPRPGGSPPTEGSLLPEGSPLREASLWRLLGGLGRRLAASLGAAPAHAAGPSRREELAERLKRWAPSPTEAREYLPVAGELLRLTADEVRASSGLPASRSESFRDLLLAAAWQESCWRQYVRRGERLVPLRSRQGDVGLMQVNERVWRGFYAVEGLRWDVGYNARAGSEILLHYLRDYAIARGEEAAGGPDALARASYAAYHGGPSHLRRYRQPKQWRPALVTVDRAFHTKLREVTAGRELGVRECFAG